MLSGLLAPAAWAQTADELAPSHTASAGTPSPDQDRDRDQGAIAELDTIQVVGQRPPDPFAFRNPVDVGDTVFSRSWREPPSLHAIGMQGGLVQLAVGYALLQGAKAVQRLPGWTPQVEAASARPPPLDPDQLARSARLLDEASGTPPTAHDATGSAGSSTNREALLVD
ncbi:hypothetical protein [Luteimonas abyssi]|uniref:hypothetical protein n=1 Tax=Luteimonas abyssi TaxID=1247514 RepID=UPI000B275B71|nr:hypothetical protein [Luteimonas abyssi]